MNLPYTHPTYLPSYFKPSKPSNSPIPSSYLQYNPTFKYQEIPPRHPLGFNSDHLFKREFEQRSPRHKPKRKGHNQVMGTLKNSLMDIKEDVSRMIEEKDFEGKNREDGRREYASMEYQDHPLLRITKKKKSIDTSDEHIKRSFMKHSEIKTQQSQMMKKYSCLSERNSSGERPTIQEVQHGLSKQCQQQASLQNLFSTPKLSPTLFPTQQSTQSQQVSRNSSYSSSPFEKLLAENIANKQAIEYLEQVVHENQSSRRELEFKMNLLQRGPVQYSAEELLKIENYKLSEALKHERYIRYSLEEKLSLHALQAQTLRRSSSLSHYPELNPECDCSFSQDYDKQIRMIEESYRTQIFSLQTEIKLVKVLLQNHEQKSKRLDTKNVYIQTDICEESYVSLDISQRDMERELESIRNETIRIILEKERLECWAEELKEENGELRAGLERAIVGKGKRVEDVEREMKNLMEEFQQREEKYKLQLCEVDAYCVQLQEENVRLKSVESVPLAVVIHLQNQIHSLEKELENRSMKIELLEKELLSGESETVDYEMQKINLIVQIKEIEDSFRGKTECLEKELETAMECCQSLRRKVELLCQEIQMRDQAGCVCGRNNPQLQFGESSKLTEDPSLINPSQCFTLQMILSQSNQIRALRQQNHLLSCFISNNCPSDN